MSSTSIAQSQAISTQLRIKFFLTGAVLPIVCFVFAASGAPLTHSPWQSGQVRDYLAMLMQWPGYVPFLPLVGFSLVCLSLWVWKQRLMRFSAVQVGIMTGVVLSLQFLIFVVILCGPITFVFAVFAGPAIVGLVFAAHAVGSRIRRFTIRHLLILTTAVAMVTALIQWTESGPAPLQLLLGMLFYAAGATPVLCTLTYLRACRHIVEASKPSENGGIRILYGMFGWLFAWLASWKIAVDIMLVEYSKLPTTDPNCYVCSAAANGHPRLVRSRRVAASGARINRQMKRLKFLELALAAACPSWHARLRDSYDRWGPSLAGLCNHSVWFADASFLCLTPLEWIAAMIRSWASVSGSRIENIYEPEPSE